VKIQFEASGKPDVNQIAGKSKEEKMRSWRIRKAHTRNCGVGEQLNWKWKLDRGEKT